MVNSNEHATSIDSVVIGFGMSTAAYGIGAYSLAEAGRLLGVSPVTIRRWLFGYSYDHHGPRTNQQPLWQPQYGADQDEPLLGFRDLIEARIDARASFPENRPSHNPGVSPQSERLGR